MSRLLEQRRAAYALKCIFDLKDGGGDGPAYSTHVHKTPVRTLQNGLGQALAFLLANRKEPSDKLYGHLQGWLCGPVTAECPCRIYSGESDLMALLMAGGRRDYLQAQEEAILLLGWLKKLADAYLEQEGQDA